MHKFFISLKASRILESLKLEALKISIFFFKYLSSYYTFVAPAVGSQRERVQVSKLLRVETTKSIISSVLSR